MWSLTAVGVIALGAGCGESGLGPAQEEVGLPEGHRAGRLRGPVYGYNSLSGWRTIVAVNSGVNPAGQARLARIDLVHGWIQQEIAAHP